jgi:hypothetical protein
MTYRLTLQTGEEASKSDRQAAEQRFRQALEASLGLASLVLPTYQAYLQIVAIYGETPDLDLLPGAEREVLEQWQAAELAAMAAAFGSHRYMDDARFEIGAWSCGLMG